MTIKIMLTDGEWTTLDNDNVALPIQLTPRIDGTFLQGSFKYWCDRSTNIPPYTPLMIDDTYYLCSSTCDKYMTEDNLYCHSIDILDASALLSAYVVGTKAFSTTGTHQSDSSKTDVLMSLMSLKYGIEVDTSIISNDPMLNGKHDFTFGAGHTLWDCMSEIGKQYKYIPRVTSITNYKHFAYEYKNVSASSEITIDESKITSKSYSQDTDNYCKTLEMEASNVVDRTTPTHLENIRVRGADYVLDTDEAVFILPTGIESIKKFGATPSLKFDLTCKFYYANQTFTPTTYDGTETTWSSEFDTKWSYMLNVRVLLASNGTYAYPMQEAKEYIMSTYGLTETQVNETIIHCNNATLTFSGYIKCDIDLTSTILEKTKWEILEAKEKVKYAVYTNGDNTISNLATNYKNNFWDSLLGNTVLGWWKTYDNDTKSNMFYQYVAFPDGTYDNTGWSLSIDVEGSTTQQYSMLNWEFYADYYPVCNPIIKNDKSITPINETAYKSLARTYNNSADTIDYDRLADAIDKSNNMLGDAELVLELDDSSDISIGSHFTMDDQTWYIVAMTKTINLDHTSYALYCSRSYSKVAEAIGVATQYNATKNALNNIVDRPIYMNVYRKYGTTINPTKAYYCLFTFKYADDTQSNALMPLAILLDTNDGNLLFCCEMLNQYSAGKYSSSVYSQLSKQESKDLAYVDSNNECAKILVQIVTDVSFNNDSALQQTMIPLVDLTKTSYTAVTEETENVVYKDSRERLTFTFKYNS